MSSSVTAVAAGYFHTCAVKNGGALYCWGINNYGQVGDGTTDTPKTTPVSIPSLTSSITAIAAGQFNTCAVRNGGGLFCWGRNDYGQVGDGGENSPILSPKIIFSNGISQVSVGLFHVCSRLNNGAMYQNSNGQIGDGSTVTRRSPTQVSGMSSGVMGITLGGNFTCAYKNDGNMYCWGLNSNGQAGAGSAATSFLSPVSLYNNFALFTLTSSPTIPPTLRPSNQPSSQPSRQPTSQPSQQPILNPSAQPSSKPISQPSRKPSSQPTTQPSRQPQTHPTSNPSSQPSQQPTIHLVNLRNNRCRILLVNLRNNRCRILLVKLRNNRCRILLVNLRNNRCRIHLVNHRNNRCRILLVNLRNNRCRILLVNRRNNHIHSRQPSPADVPLHSLVCGRLPNRHVNRLQCLVSNLHGFLLVNRHVNQALNLR
jgi:hypothetical protein